MAIPDPPREEIFAPGGHVCLESLSEPAAKVLQESMRLARETRWNCLRSPHIFMGLLAVPDRGVRAWGDLLRADLANLLDQFQELFNLEEGDNDALLVLNREFMSDNVITLLKDARTRANEHQRKFITPMDLLITLLTASNSIVADCFERIGVTAAKLTELAMLAERQVDK